MIKNNTFFTALFLLFGFLTSHAQYDFITPASTTKLEYAGREITFSKVTMNGQKTTFLAVAEGEEVNITTRIESQKSKEYCPGCIVQVYWGIHEYTSVCAKSFGGYRFTKRKSTQNFTAPMKAGIYYITLGGSLEYSCKNTLERPRCEAEYAFAVLQVGNPDPEKKVSFSKEERAGEVFLKSTLLKPGAYGDLDQLVWLFEGEKLAQDNQKEISLSAFGTYTTIWSNCQTSVEQSYVYSLDEPMEEELLVQEEIVEEEVEESNLIVNDALPTESTDIAMLIETSDSFVLQNLIFDLNKYAIKPEAQIELDTLAQIMKAKPSMKILLEGHTAIGNANRNKALSERRVKATKKYLVAQGVDKNNIETKGWGQEKPLVITRDVAKGRINRRVEIRILSR